MIKVMLFAGMKEKVGREQIIYHGTSLRVAELREWLAEAYPQLAEDIPQAMVAVNEEFADESTMISEQDQVALIPPVSGG